MSYSFSASAEASACTRGAAKFSRDHANISQIACPNFEAHMRVCKILRFENLALYIYGTALCEYLYVYNA